MITFFHKSNDFNQFVLDPSNNSLLNHLGSHATSKNVTLHESSQMICLKIKAILKQFFLI